MSYLIIILVLAGMLAAGDRIIRWIDSFLARHVLKYNGTEEEEEEEEKHE